MDKNIQAQQPFTTNQVENEKPGINRSFNTLSAPIAGSFNGGHNRTVHFKRIMAGEKHAAYRLRMNINLLTPLTPAYQRLNLTLRTFFVPNSAVWENAEEYTAQNGGSTQFKIEKRPSLAGFEIPYIEEANDGTYGTPMYNTATWRDCFISSYIPRMGIFRTWQDWRGSQNKNQKPFVIMPEYDALPLRGFVKIYNTFLRNKEYDEEIQEFKGDTVTESEWKTYIPDWGNNDPKKYTIRAKKPNSYYTDYRKELQGFEDTVPGLNDDNALITWASWESKIAEARSQAEMAQANAWDVIAKIRGSKKLTEGKPQLISEKTIPINYSAITQNTYNTNEGIQEAFQVMGKQGAYSYTEIDDVLYSGVEFKEEGYIHVIATVWASTTFESGFDRLIMTVNALDEYRPDMQQDKNDVLYTIETGSGYIDQDEANELSNQAMGFKRKYSEYFKMPNCIFGDMTSNDYYNYEPVMNEYNEGNKIITNSTYQFFEKDNRRFYTNDYTEAVTKYEHLDYTDLLINKNQAIMNYFFEYNNPDKDSDVIVAGQNQIFYVGAAYCIADLPIAEEIKNNYTKWGEH